MGAIAGRLILLAGGFGLFMWGLMVIGNIQGAAPKLEDFSGPLYYWYWQDAMSAYLSSRWVEVLGSFAAMLIGVIFIIWALSGSVETAVSMDLPKIIIGAINMDEDEFEAERRGGQKCPDCGSYDTYYVETVGVDTAQFKCKRCGSYFLKD